jgi:hypothetical protein
MGANPDEIERQIAQQRARIDEKMKGLETRIRDDVENVRAEATTRASGTVSGAKEIFQPDGPMRDHPLSMMAGALGLGVVLGMVSEGLTADGHDSSRGRHDGYSRDTRSSESSGGIASMLSSLIGPAAMTAQNEIQDLVKEGFSSLKGRNNGTSDTLRQNRDVGVE